MNLWHGITQTCRTRTANPGVSREQVLSDQTSADLGGLLASYDRQGFFCELQNGASDAHHVLQRIDALELETLHARSKDADRELYNLGITFTVYTEREAIDRILPFDIIPRVISAADWAVLEKGVKQRVAALNAFLGDIYGAGRVFADNVIPRDLVEGNKNYRPQMRNVDLPHGTYVHICGTDLVRGDDGAFRVLEDNARTPSGVSYVVENRHLMQRAFADLMDGIGVRPVSDYGQRLHAALSEVAPEGVSEPRVVLLSPGVYNSAYFEHVFLAREMGVPLVEGRDLTVREDGVFVHTISGQRPVHVIYRRIDDDFLDPLAFRKDSVLGVPGLFEAYRKGKVTLANAVGTGVADDKAVYAYMPRLIQYYLGEEAIIANVDTHICREKEGLERTLDELASLVVKPVGESGGYGITVGPRASAEEIEKCRKSILADPANWISQPMVNLSVSPTLTPDGIEPRHVDLRPFAVTGQDTWVLPGGLTRVALKKGSIIVNSSQGGGSKDTWVLE